MDVVSKAGKSPGKDSGERYGTGWMGVPVGWKTSLGSAVRRGWRGEGLLGTEARLCRGTLKSLDFILGVKRIS